ncbi:exosome complex component RRP45A-like protein isoform X1 [Tanacetum coccineum]
MKSITMRHLRGFLGNKDGNLMMMWIEEIDLEGPRTACRDTHGTGVGADGAGSSLPPSLFVPSWGIHQRSRVTDSRGVPAIGSLLGPGAREPQAPTLFRKLFHCGGRLPTSSPASHKQSLSVPFNFALQTGWGQGLAEERQLFPSDLSVCGFYLSTSLRSPVAISSKTSYLIPAPPTIGKCSQGCSEVKELSPSLKILLPSMLPEVPKLLHQLGLVIDPTHYEEAVMRGSMTATLNTNGDVCVIQKAGGSGVLQSSIMQCLRNASVMADDITSKIKNVYGPRLSICTNVRPDVIGIGRVMDIQDASPVVKAHPEHASSMNKSEDFVDAEGPDCIRWAF